MRKLLLACLSCSLAVFAKESVQKENNHRIYVGPEYMGLSVDQQFNNVVVKDDRKNLVGGQIGYEYAKDGGLYANVQASALTNGRGLSYKENDIQVPSSGRMYLGKGKAVLGYVAELADMRLIPFVGVGSQIIHPVKAGEFQEKTGAALVGLRTKWDLSACSSIGVAAEGSRVMDFSRSVGTGETKVTSARKGGWGAYFEAPIAVQPTAHMTIEAVPYYSKRWGAEEITQDAFGGAVRVGVAF